MTMFSCRGQAGMLVVTEHKIKKRKKGKAEDPKL